jgi:long-chain fatty acid transport protein
MKGHKVFLARAGQGQYTIGALWRQCCAHQTFQRRRHDVVRQAWTTDVCQNPPIRPGHNLPADAACAVAISHLRKRHGVCASKEIAMRALSLYIPACRRCIVLGLALLCSGEIGAAGFALNEMSAAAIGNAFAGSAAAAEDIGTIYYNPAGLSRMSGRQFMLTGTALRPSVQFANQGTLGPAGSPATGGNGGDAGSWNVVPALFYAADLAPRLRLGIGVYSPFGLKTDYDERWVGRYQALKSELKTLNLNPTLAYAVSEQFSVGIGVSAQYAKVELSRAIDFGSVCAARVGLAACARGGLLPQGKDGQATLDGNDWAFGLNLGALYAPTPALRIGVAYRSAIRHRFSGDARYDKPAGLPALLATAAAFSNTGIEAGLDLPESVNLSVYRELDSKWSLLSDINWTRWARFDELRVHFGNGAPDSVVREDWRNAFRLGLAVNYRYNDAWKLRAGLAFEQSPVKPASRTPSVPDAGRRLLAFGAQYKPSAQSTWDFAYMHIFVSEFDINRPEPPLGGTVKGRYQNDVNLLSIQYSHAF